MKYRVECSYQGEKVEKSYVVEAESEQEAIKKMLFVIALKSPQLTMAIVLGVAKLEAKEDSEESLSV